MALGFTHLLVGDAAVAMVGWLQAGVLPEQEDQADFCWAVLGSLAQVGLLLWVPVSSTDGV